MYLSKSVTTQYGNTASYWGISLIQYDAISGVWTVTLGGWSTQTAFTSLSTPMSFREFTFTATALNLNTSTLTLNVTPDTLLKAVLTKIQALGASDPLYGATLSS